jgi:hypothetical protein
MPAHRETAMGKLAVFEQPFASVQIKGVKKINPTDY